MRAILATVRRALFRRTQGENLTTLRTLHALDPAGIDTAALEARLPLAEGREPEARDRARQVRERDPENALIRPLATPSPPPDGE